MSAQRTDWVSRIIAVLALGLSAVMFYYQFIREAHDITALVVGSFPQAATGGGLEYSSDIVLTNNGNRPETVTGADFYLSPLYPNSAQNVEANA